MWLEPQIIDDGRNIALMAEGLRANCPAEAEALSSYFNACGACGFPHDVFERSKALFLQKVPEVVRRHLHDEGWRAYLLLSPFDIDVAANEIGTEFAPARCLRRDKVIYAAMHSKLGRDGWQPNFSMYGYDVLSANLAHEAGHCMMRAYDDAFVDAVRADIDALGGQQHLLPQHRATGADRMKPVREIWADGLACVWGLPVYPPKLLYQMLPCSMAYLYKFSRAMTHPRCRV